MKKITWKHKLKLVKKATGSQKAKYVCIHCKCPFAFYGKWTIKETEDYVNKYYPEVTMMWHTWNPGSLEKYWKSLSI